PVLVAGEGDAIAEVDVLAVHEEILVQQAHLVERSFPQEHAGAGKDLDRGGLVLRKMAQMVAAEKLALREQTSKADDLEEGYLWRGQSALRFRQETARSVDHLHAQPADERISVHE